MDVRIFRDKLIEILKGKNSYKWFANLEKSNYLFKVLPEFQKAKKIDGGAKHNETVHEHLIKSLKAADKYHWKLKLAVLLHDIGKPEVVQPSPTGFTFYKHEVAGATIAYRFCKRIKIDRETTEYVSKMVRSHMFHFTEETTDKTIKKWLIKLGKNDWRDIFALRAADRRGNAKNKWKPSITREMKLLIKRIEKLIDTHTVLFKEDINISDLEIIGCLPKHMKDTNLNHIYNSLINLINEKPKERNKKEWLRAYIIKTYEVN